MEFHTLINWSNPFRIFFVISFLFLLCFRARLFIDALWSPAGKGLTFWLSFVMSNCEVGTPGWCLIVSIPDHCPLLLLCSKVVSFKF